MPTLLMKPLQAFVRCCGCPREGDMFPSVGGCLGNDLFNN